MATDLSWLDRLGQATDYQQLQSIFSEIAFQARQSTDGPKLASSIDDAIRRIEHERARDQDELADQQQQYDEFKSQQSGVTGWFKRHLPFSETRKQERIHRDTVNDQQAEILADNLFIARCQILKQHLLPSDQRQLGLLPDQWRTRLRASESIDQLRAFGKLIVELTCESKTSKVFVQQVCDDIDAFQAASFSDKQSQQRQSEDVRTVRAELAVLDAEIKTEQSLQADAIKRAQELVSEELSMHDATYYSLLQRSKQLQVSREKLQPPMDSARQLSELFAARGKLSDEAAKSVRDQHDLQGRSERLRGELNAARQRHSQAAQHVADVSVHHDHAKRRYEQASAGWEAAKRIVDQHLATTTIDQASVAPTDPAVTEFNRLQQDRDAAQDAWRIAAAPYDLATTQRDKTKGDVDKLESDLRGLEYEITSLIKKLNDTERKLEHSADEIPAATSELEPLLNDYFVAIEPLEWQSLVTKLSRTLEWKSNLSSTMTHSRPRRFGVLPSPSPNSKETERFFQSIVTALSQDATELDRQRTTADQQRLAAWQRRCRELLDHDAAAVLIDSLKRI